MVLIMLTETSQNKHTIVMSFDIIESRHEKTCMVRVFIVRYLDSIIGMNFIFVDLMDV